MLNTLIIPSSPFVDAASLCLSKGVAFALFSLPGSDEIRFFSNPSRSFADDCGERFSIVPWGCDSRGGVDILNELDLDQTLSRVPLLESDDRNPRHQFQKSTDRERYIKDVSSLIGRLRSNGGKVVVSRISTINDCISDAQFTIKVIDEIRRQRTAFGFLFYTYETGCWAGLSPEKLLDMNFDDGGFSTVALAGTRPAGRCVEWDGKNIAEHNYVVGHINSVLKCFDADYRMGHCRTISAGQVEHLMTPFEGVLRNSSWQRLIDGLHPTPAIAGYPVSSALNEISAVETHQRRCYGGYIAFRTDRFMVANLTLRCLEYSGGCCCLYAGGGITGDSVAEDEWSETELKMSAMNVIADPSRSCCVERM